MGGELKRAFERLSLGFCAVEDDKGRRRRRRRRRRVF